MIKGNRGNFCFIGNNKAENPAGTLIVDGQNIFVFNLILPVLFIDVNFENKFVGGLELDSLEVNASP
jgi:hypothetical protein